MTAGAPVLLYDGACGFCSGTVQFVLRHDHRDKLRFAALQGDYGSSLRSRHPELDTVDSVVWVEPGEPTAEGTASERILLRSDAVLAVGRYLGGWWSALARLGGGVPRAWRDALYRLVARHRHRLPGGQACLIPTDETRARFLE